MDSEQLSTYLSLLDWPSQLSPSPHPASLALLQARHLMTIPYQSRDLHQHALLPRPSLSVAALLPSLASRGGHCYQHSELMFSALVSLGYTVSRVSTWVLNGSQFRKEKPRTHNILVVSLEGAQYLVDVGFASSSPRYPLRLTFSSSEEVQCAEGERYLLEVEGSLCTLNIWLSDHWFALYAFERVEATNTPRVVDAKDTMELFSLLYTSPATIGIRDVSMKISIQTQDSRINFDSTAGVHTLKRIRAGSKVEERVFASLEDFYACAKTWCKI